MTKRAMPGNVLLPAVLAVFLFVLVGDAFAVALTIKEAKWESGDKILVVKGIGPARTRVTVKNADDDSIVYGSTRSKRGEGEWKLKKRGLSAPPCSVLAEAGVENNKKTVNGAGSDCVGSVPPIDPPPEDTCDISVAPLTVPFGDVTVGQTGTGSTVVSNNGTATCNVTVVPGGSADFSAVPLSFDVAPDGSQTVSVSYEPGQAGQDTGTLAVNSNDPDTATVNVSLTGNGVAAPVQACNISVTPTALAFGDVNVGQSSELITTVNNTGTADCNVELVQTGSDDFEVALPASFTVAAGGSRNVSVNYAPADAGEDTGNVAVNSIGPDTTTVNVALSGKGVELQACNPADANLSINSTSQNGCPDGAVPQVAQVPNDNYSILAVNDLGMHCGDLDTRIASILPPFQAMLAQVIQKGASPTLNPDGVDLFYSAAANPADPILTSDVFDGLNKDGTTYKTNFWDTVARGSYDPFYPAFNPFTGDTLTPLAGPPFNVGPDVGLPVPNVEHFYLGTDGIAGNGDESLSAVLHAMSGIADPYVANDRQLVQEHYTDKPFFINFPFGYVAEGVNWYEGAGIPFAAFDDNGRENAYPLVSVEARQGNATVSTVDTVLPISGEASCVNCHADPDDLMSVNGITSQSTAPTDVLSAAGLPVVTSLADPDDNLPARVSLEYAADINTLRLHDHTHGAKYVTPTGDSTVAEDPCEMPDTDPANPNPENGSASCLTNKALVQDKPVVCQVCHYTPALDLAHLGPLTGPPGTVANGRNHLHHKSNSNVMHSHHGSLGVFPEIPAAVQAANGRISNQDDRLAALQDSCYQCHPGKNVQCLRGAMFNGGMLCSDCHGGMEEVGNDFTANVTVTNPGPDAWVLGGDFYDANDPQPRVPWANEPGCGSCHTGDANNNLAGGADVVTNLADTMGNPDNIRLRQAFRNGDAKATPIVPTNKRFAEPEVPAATAAGDANPGAGNPQLYRVSTGHGGVMCEGCHGATHAEWPNANPNANDNVTADQLQGHTGTIIECSTCHDPSAFEDSGEHELSMNGPHGMHAVGSETWNKKHKEARVGGGDNCRACHGNDGEGTVLSRMSTDRVLECKDEKGTKCADEGPQLFEKGYMVGCGDCHQNVL